MVLQESLYNFSFKEILNPVYTYIMLIASELMM